MLGSDVAHDAVAVTPSDTAPVEYYGLYIGVTGDVTVKGRGGNAVLFKSCPAGMIIPMKCWAVMATGTTATSITGFLK